MSKRQSPRDREMVIIEFSRQAIAQGDISSALERLNALSIDAATALRFESAVTFIFTGWDQEKYEIYQVPLIRKWFERLSDRWGYWAFFAEKIGPTVPLVMSLLCKGTAVRRPEEPGMIGWLIDPDAVGPTMRFLFDRQNALCERLGLGDEVNMRVSRDFDEAIAAFLE